MLSCDYNGWNDAPEDEREALEAYEAAAERATVALNGGDRGGRVGSPFRTNADLLERFVRGFDWAAAA